MRAKQILEPGIVKIPKDFTVVVDDIAFQVDMITDLIVNKESSGLYVRLCHNQVVVASIFSLNSLYVESEETTGCIFIRRGKVDKAIV